MQHLLVFVSCESFAPLNSHAVVLSVNMQKYHQTDGQNEKRHTSRVFNFHPHAGFFISILRLEASCFVFLLCKGKPRNEIMDGWMYLKLCMQLRQELHLHACFIGVKRRDGSEK